MLVGLGGIVLGHAPRAAMTCHITAVIGIVLALGVTVCRETHCEAGIGTVPPIPHSRNLLFCVLCVWHEGVSGGGPAAHVFIRALS